MLEGDTHKRQSSSADTPESTEGPMQYPDLPRVRDGALRFPINTVDAQAPVLVGSEAWYERLEQIASFGFEDHIGRSFTARRERREQQCYWYAYRKRGKQLRKVYLGKTDQLDPARLQAAARELAELPRDAQPLSSPAPLIRPPAGGLSAEQAADVFLRSTKLRIPATLGNPLERPRLTQQLRCPLQETPAAVSLGHRHAQPLLTVITAAAGYGKTTLLSQWLHQSDDLDVGWLSLDPEDNDPKQFWRYLIAALQASVPELGRQALLLLQETQPSAIDEAIIALLADLQHTPNAVVLVLDDYHVIDTPALHDSLAVFLEHCPAHVHVVISGRMRPPLPFGRLRLHSDIVELQSADLQLTGAEGHALLSRDPGLASNHQAIATVLRNTGGWLAGVNLFALALQHHGDLESVLAKFDGSHQYLSEYFFENVWRQQTPALQAFLLHTALLDNLTGPLCEAVTGLPNGQQMLARAEQANLFLFALEQRPGWYRYHQLFLQALRRMLEQLRPEEVPALHRRAAGWYLEHHSIGDALHHLIAGQAWLEAAQVLEQHALPLFQAGDVARLLGWLGQLPQEFVHARPALLVLKARALLLTGEMNALQAWLEHLESTTTSESVLEEVATIRSLVGTSAAAGGSASVCASTDWESLDAFTLSMHAWARDDTQKSYDAAARAVQAGQASGLRSVALLAASTMATLHIIRGELHAALRVAHEGLALDHTTEAAILAGSHQPNPAAGPILMALGAIYYERNRIELAQQCLEKALELCARLGREDHLFTAHALLARTYGASGQWQQAHALMQAGVDRAREGRIDFWPEADLLAYQAWIWLGAGELTLAGQWAQTAFLRLDDPQINQRRIAYWVYGEVLLAQGQYEQAAHILGRLVHSAPQIGTRAEPLIKLLVAYASALFAQGQRAAALPVLERALGIGQAEGDIRPFLDIAPRHTRALLEYYHQKTRAEAHIEEYLQQLLTASEPVPFSRLVPADGTTPAMALSRREREILRLVERGLSNPEIARKLVIEANTVKSHLHHIYQRLSVSTRYQAVMHAKIHQML
jgi:LuxR family transcriptional regulator, maltose regulon positive regulatory protein